MRLMFHFERCNNAKHRYEVVRADSSPILHGVRVANSGRITAFPFWRSQCLDGIARRPEERLLIFCSNPPIRAHF